MPTTSDYLSQLQQDREDLVDNLETKGITGLTGDETFTELVPEVLNIQGGSSANLQTKSITVTQNGSITIEPDNGYDGLERVNLTTNIQSNIYRIPIITNGVANVSYVYERTGGNVSSGGEFTENYNNNGYAFATSRVWASYHLTFSSLQLKKGYKIVLEYARETAWTGSNSQYATFDYGLVKNGTSTETNILNGRQTTNTKTTLTIDVDDEYDSFYLAFVNLADTNSYSSYGVAIYNLWIEATFEYVQDGLIAWFDEMEPIEESDEKWHSKVGNDYIYVSHRTLGSQSSNPYTKEANAPLINFANFSFSNTVDYYQTGYTWEVVGKINHQNGNSGANSGFLITPNTQYCVGIGIMSIHSTKTNPVRLDYFNDDSTISSDPTYQVNYGEYFGASVYLKAPKGRGVTGKSVVEASIHGSPFEEATQNNSTSHNNTASYMSFLSYYYNNYKASGAIRCIRIYNRKLTDAELAHNHAIDKARFNLNN